MKACMAVSLFLCLVVAVAVLPVVSVGAQPVSVSSASPDSPPPSAVLASRPYEGTIDLSFDPGTGTDASVNAIALQPDGKVVIGGSFTEYDGVDRSRVARVQADGSLDTSFDPGTGTNLGTTIYAVAVQPDGRILIAGSFSSYNEIPRSDIARLNADGSLDTTFDPGDGFDGNVLAMALQPDGKILLAGDFSEFDHVARQNVARLNTDGSLDTTFDPGVGPDDRVHSIARQLDGKVLIGGYFNQVDGQDRHHLARLKDDGSLDTTFDPGTVLGYYAIIYAIVVQPDGKILVGGSFDQYDGHTVYGLARAKADGSIDTSFDPGVGTNNGVLAIARQPNGRVLVAGGFDDYNWITRWHIARAMANGALDTTFDPGDGTDSLIQAMVLQPDGKILIGGDFTTYDNVSRHGLARVNGFGWFLYLPLTVRAY